MTHWLTWHIPLAVYVLLGPVVWAGMLVELFNERRRMSKPIFLKQPLPDPAPTVTILVPARNEEAGIRRCIELCLAQNYPRFNVIAVDDRSGDGTAAELDRLAALHPNLKVLHITEIPPGWTGKNHALHQGTRQADGEWLLFVDSDCNLASDALRVAVAGAVAPVNLADLVSYVAAVGSKSFWERLIVPVAGLIASILDRGLKEPYAYGWFMLISRRMYDKVGGHENIRDVLNDDKVLARRVKEEGGRPRVWWGCEMASLVMERKPMDIVKGLGRNFYVMTPGRPWRALFCLAFLLLCCYSALGALAYGLSGQTLAGAWLIAAVVHLALLVISFASLYYIGRTSPWLAAAFPLALVMSTLIFLRAIWICLTGRVHWRTTHYKDAAGSATQIPIR